eukprot:1140920-Pelagomonas_calceolata.AAC.6
MSTHGRNPIDLLEDRVDERVSGVYTVSAPVKTPDSYMCYKGLAYSPRIWLIGCWLAKKGIKSVFGSWAKGREGLHSCTCLRGQLS